MTYPTPCHTPQTRHQIFEAVRRLIERTTAILGDHPDASIPGVTNFYVHELTCAGNDAPQEELERRARFAARQIVEQLVDCPDFAWWGTDLGRACAWWIGYQPDQEQVPREVVAGILGVTKQRVHALAMRKVHEGGNQTFTPAEVRTLLRARWDRLIVTEEAA